MLPIFVISLSNAVDRRRKIEKQFSALNIPFEWFDAIEGKNLNEQKVNELCDIDAINNSPNWLTKGAIGCALSHYYVYKEIIKRNLTYALVMEDDVLLNKDFKLVIEKIVATNENKISLLYYQSWQPLELSKKNAILVSHDYHLYQPVNIDQPITAAAYIISLNACKTMVEKMFPIKYAADSWGNFYHCGGFKNMDCLFPMLVETSDAKSTIDYIRNKKLSTFLKIIDNYKLFPFYHLLKIRRKHQKRKMLKVRLVNKQSFHN